MNIPYLLSSKGPNYQRGILITSVGAIEVHLEKTRHWKVTKMALFLHDNVPSHRVISNQKMLAYPGFHSLDHPANYNHLAPSVYQLIPEIKSTYKILSIFVRHGCHFCRVDLYGRTNFLIY
jgi:hypothetical protein